LKESIAGHTVVDGVYSKLGKGNTGGRQEAERACFYLQVLLKSMLTYMKGRTRGFPCNNQ
jgi:hypothetical protein